MKRTAEIILTVIGVLLSLGGAVITAIMVFFTNSDFTRESFAEGYNEGAMEIGEPVNPGEADMFLNFFVGFGWIVFVAALIGIILGTIAIFFYIGNKKAKVASIMLIIAAAVVGLGTFFIGFIPALLFLIAGIVGLVRKPPENLQATEI